MATKTQVNNFIDTLGPVIQKVCFERGYKIASTVIAQACLETGYGNDRLSKYYNYFGMKCGKVWKGPSVNLATMEEYVLGQLTNITANFRVYPDMLAGINGYYDFINWSNYANLKNANSFEEYAKLLKQDGWATDSQYTAKLCRIVNDNGLTRFDVDPADSEPEQEASILYRVITTKGLNVRKGPSTENPIVGCLKYKTIFSVTRIENNWGYVPSKKGWCCLDYCEIK